VRIQANLPGAKTCITSLEYLLAVDVQGQHASRAIAPDAVGCRAFLDSIAGTIFGKYASLTIFYFDNNRAGIGVDSQSVEVVGVKAAANDSLMRRVGSIAGITGITSIYFDACVFNSTLVDRRWLANARGARWYCHPIAATPITNISTTGIWFIGPPASREVVPKDDATSGRSKWAGRRARGWAERRARGWAG